MKTTRSPWPKRGTFAMLVLAVALGMTNVVALDEERYPSALGAVGVGAPQPNALLPKDVPAPEGKLTLYADFSKQAGDAVPLYLVNRTDAPVVLDSQDGNIYLKLEHRLADGTWERAQAHLSSWCGNSYMAVKLSPGQHFAFNGYMPSAGQKSTVRFSGYGRTPLVSNEGDGFVLTKDVADARRDVLGRHVAYSLESLLDPRQRTYGDEPTPASTVAALRLLLSAGQNPFYEEAASQLAGRWEKNPKASDAEKKGAKAIRALLAGHRSDRLDLDALMDRGLAALASPEANAGQFGRLEVQPEMVWSALEDLATSGMVKEPGKWKALVDFAVAHPTDENIRGVTGVLAVSRIADELLPDDFFEKYLFVSDERVQTVCAQTLSRRGNWSALTQLGWKLPPRGQIIVLSALARPKPDGIESRSRNPDSEDEDKFWSHCLETQPLEAAEWLRVGMTGESNPYNRGVHDPMHDFLAAEADRVAEKGEFKLDANGARWRLLVDFLASWNLEEDDPIFAKLLSYGGFEENEYSTGENKRFNRRSFGVRDAAKRALLKRGKPVPTNLVVEQDFPL